MTFHLTFTDLFAFGCVVLSAAVLIRTEFIIRFTPRLRDQQYVLETHLMPTVDILLPVRNEERRILRENVDSLASQDYPCFTVVVIDDHSTDGTVRLLDQAAATYSSRLTILKSRPLQNNWLGKLNALEVGKQATNSKWILAVDADVVYHRSTLATAMSYICEHSLDALSLLPEVRLDTFWESVIIPAISWLSLMRVSPTQANRPTSRYCFGYGNFILFRRELHDIAGGYAAYSADVLDDCATMERLKKNGARVGVADGRGFLSTRMYSCLSEIVEGFSKNTFAALNYSYVHTFVVLAFLYLLTGGPVSLTGAALLIGMKPLLVTLILCGLSFGFFGIAMFRFGRAIRADWRFMSCYLLGFTIAGGIILYSAMLSLTRRGGTWKSRRILVTRDRHRS